MTSMTEKESCALPPSGSRMLAWIIATEAARATRMVVRNPAACPRAPRFSPMTAPASIVNAKRKAISVQVGLSGMFMGVDRMLAALIVRIRSVAATSGDNAMRCGLRW